MLKSCERLPLPTIKKQAGKLPRLFCYALLTVIAFVFIYPFLYMLATSLKSMEDVNNISVYWIPTELAWDNFQLAAQAMNLKYGMINSGIVSILSTVGHVLSCAMIGYGFARYNFPLRTSLFIGVILSSIIPVQTTIISQYIVYDRLGFLGTLAPLIIPCFFGFGLRGGIYIFLFRQFFMRFPRSLEEAALLDGCGRIKTFWRIAFPSAQSSVLVVCVLSLVWHWNDYYEPKIYLTGGPRKQMLTQNLPSLYDLLKESHEQIGEVTDIFLKYHEGVIMAATTIAFVPIMIMFFVLQRRFMEGIERSGLVE